MNWKVPEIKAPTKEQLDYIKEFLEKEQNKYKSLLNNKDLRPELKLEWEHALNAIEIMLIELKIKYKRLEVE